MIQRVDVRRVLDQLPGELERHLREPGIRVGKLLALTFENGGTDARAELERIAGVTPTPLPEATPAECDAALKKLFPQIEDSLFYCTGLAA